jgi:hypothetical protein
MRKKHLLVQERPPKNFLFKKISDFDIILVLKHWVTLPKVKYRKAEDKIDQEVHKNNLVYKFSINCFLERLFGLFNILSYSGTKAAYTSLFSGWFTIRNFRIFKKHSFAFFLDISWEVFCLQNKHSPPVHNCV